MAWCFVAVSPSHAQQIQSTPDGTVVFDAGIDGVRFETKPDKSWRLYSRKDQQVLFFDRAGILKAQTIAEEKAKAAIVSFIQQHVATGTIVTEIDNTINRATASGGTGQERAISSNSQRQMIQNVSTITGTAAAGTLRGVIILERGYDQKNMKLHGSRWGSAIRQ